MRLPSGSSTTALKLEGAFAGATKFVPKDWEPVRQFEEIAGTFAQKTPAKK